MTKLLYRAAIPTLRSLAHGSALALTDRPALQPRQSASSRRSPYLSVKRGQGLCPGKGAAGPRWLRAAGIEGNYTLAARIFIPTGATWWLEYAKGVLSGKSVLDLPLLTSQWDPVKRRWTESYASAIDNCLRDILAKLVGLPIYRISELQGPRSGIPSSSI